MSETKVEEPTPPVSPVQVEEKKSTDNNSISPSNESSQSVSKKEEETESEGEKSKENAPRFTSVTDVGVCADQNWKYRRRMEDAHYMEDGFNGDSSSGFFAVYDGHGGKEAAIFASENFHKILAEEINKEGPSIFSNPEAFLQAKRRAYLATDEKLKGAVPSHHGCTAVTCLVVGKGESRQLFAANVGDARAVLSRGGKAIRLTEEHKASEVAEAKRITDSGGFIINGRVNGQIIITRSLGDHLMKEFIIGDPHLRHEKLTAEDTHLIVACDGLWDVVEDQQAVDFVLQHKDSSAGEISKKLLIKALQDGTTDNLSIMVIKL